MIDFKVNESGETISFSDKELFVIRLLPLELAKPEMLILLSVTEEEWELLEFSIFRKLGVINWTQAIVQSFTIKVLHKNQFIDPTAKKLTPKYAKLIYDLYDKKINEKTIEEIIRQYFDAISSNLLIDNNNDEGFDSHIEDNENYFQAFNMYRKKIRDFKHQDATTRQNQLSHIKSVNTSLLKLLAKKRTSHVNIIDMIALYLQKSFNEWDYNNISEYKDDSETRHLSY